MPYQSGTFYFALTVKSGLGLVSHVLAERGWRDPAAATPNVKGFREPKMKILIVNDEESLREMMTALLTEAGHEIETVADGDAAMRLYCESGAYDLVLSDVWHPGIDGIELVERIRERNPAQAVAFVSGILGIVELEHQPKVPVLATPFRREQLLDFIEAFA